MSVKIYLQIMTYKYIFSFKKIYIFKITNRFHSTLSWYVLSKTSLIVANAHTDTLLTHENNIQT